MIHGATYYLFLNENWNISIFDKYVSQCKNYNKKRNFEIIKTVKPNETGLKRNTLYYWLKQDDPEYFKQIRKGNKNEIYELVKNLTHNQVAKYYYNNIEPFKYCRSEASGWYEYNQFNILEPRGTNPPPSLLNNLSNTLQELFLNERNNLKLPTPTGDSEENEKQRKLFMAQIKVYDKAYISLGNSRFTKCCMDYLVHLYTVKDFDKLLDDNNHLLAFDDGILYNISNDQFRYIQPHDFISKTTGRNSPTIINNDKIEFNINKNKIEEVNKLIYSVFENKDMVDYWLKIFGASIFTTKHESMYILTGKGGNGKGLLMELIKETLGSYFYECENTFLTSTSKSTGLNPSLIAAKGSRVLSVSEPSDGSDKCELNCEFIKKLTGRDDITGRALYGNMITYKPKYNVFLQCNDIPNMKKLDNGMKRRLKIINYKFQFVSNPINPDDRLRDNSIKDRIKKDDNLINAFLYLLIQAAKVSTFEEEIIQPQEIKDALNNYFEDNNPVQSFLLEYFEITKDKKDRVKCSEFNDRFNRCGTEKLSPTKIIKDMAFNGFDIYKSNGIKYFVGIKTKIIESEDNPLDM